MAVIRTVVSSSAAERIEAARAFLAALPAAAQAMVLGASREAADDLVRRVTVTAGATFGLERASLTQLAARMAAGALARLGAAPTSALGAAALAARSTFEALGAGALGYFEPVARFPGFARALASTLDELRLARVSSGALAQLGHGGAAAKDVGELLARFEDAMRTGGLADRAALFELATLAAAEETAIGRMPIVLLDVPILSPAELAFVAALVSGSREVLVTVPEGDDRTLAALEELGARREELPSRAAVLEKQGARRGDSTPARVPVGAAGGASALAHLREYLFAEAAPAGPAEPGEAIFFSAPGEGREAVEIARRITEEARDGTPFDRMAVLLRAPVAYSSLFETALHRAGIPAFFARGARRPDPAGRALLLLLDCALEKLSARRFAEYLSLGQVPTPDGGGAPPTGRQVWVAADDEVLVLGPGEIAPDGQTAQDAASSDDEQEADLAGSGAADSAESPVLEGSLRAPWKWERLLVDSAVIGGRERWSRRLTGLAAEQRVRLDELRAEEPDSPRLA